jgi:hypothetical protein
MRGNSLLMTALERGASRDMVEAVLEFQPFKHHSPEDQEALVALAERAGRGNLVQSFRRPVPKGVPRAAHEAHERGIRSIELGRADAGGISYFPLEMPECINFYHIDSRGRTEVGYALPPWLLSDKDREEMERCGALWFEPFIEKLKNGEDFTIEALQRAHRTAKGRELGFNTIVS